MARQRATDSSDLIVLQEVAVVATEVVSVVYREMAEVVAVVSMKVAKVVAAVAEVVAVVDVEVARWT